MEQFENKKKERELIALTEKLYIYKDDPFKILFKNKRLNGTLNLVQYVNKADIPIDYSIEERPIILTLKEIYKQFDPNTHDGKVGLAGELPKLFPNIVDYIPNNIAEEAHTAMHGSESAQASMQNHTAGTPTDEPKVIGRDAPFDENALEEIDRKENELIVRQMEGIISINPENFFYEIDISGQKVIGINVYGANELLRFIGIKRASKGQPGYEVVKVERGETEDKVWTETYIRDKLADITLPAYVEEPKQIKLKTGAIKPDLHARGKADSKSLRNAELKFIPTKDLIDFYREWKRGGTGR